MSDYCSKRKHAERIVFAKLTCTFISVRQLNCPLLTHIDKSHLIWLARRQVVAKVRGSSTGTDPGGPPPIFGKVNFIFYIVYIV